MLKGRRWSGVRAVAAPKARAGDDAGVTLIELMIAIAIFSVILTITLATVLTYMQQFQFTGASFQAQNYAQDVANSLEEELSNAAACPGATSAVLAAPPQLGPGKQLVVSVVQPGLLSSTTSTSLPATTNVQVLTVALDPAAGELSAKTAPCPGYTGGTREPIDDLRVTGVSLTYALSPTATTSTTGVGGSTTTWVWPYTSTQSPGAGALASILAITYSVTAHLGGGPNVTITDESFFHSAACDTGTTTTTTSASTTSAPPVGGCE